MTSLRTLLALLALAACGGDVSIVVRSSFGTITEDASCEGSGGRFALGESGGLVAVVIVDDDTRISAASGLPATCRDLTEGSLARVTGAEEDGEIRADEIELSG